VRKGYFVVFFVVVEIGNFFNVKFRPKSFFSLPLFKKEKQERKKKQWSDFLIAYGREKKSEFFFFIFNKKVFEWIF
jgi:hypothetical protein